MFSRQMRIYVSYNAIYWLWLIQTGKTPIPWQCSQNTSSDEAGRRSDPWSVRGFQAAHRRTGSRIVGRQFSSSRGTHWGLSGPGQAACWTRAGCRAGGCQGRGRSPAGSLWHASWSCATCAPSSGSACSPRAAGGWCPPSWRSVPGTATNADTVAIRPAHPVTHVIRYISNYTGTGIILLTSFFQWLIAVDQVLYC